MAKHQEPQNEVAAAAEVHTPEASKVPQVAPMPAPVDDTFFEGWDSEERITDLKELTCSLIGTTLAIHAAFKAALDDQLGIPANYIMTKSFPDGRVWIAASRKRPGAKPLRTGTTPGTAEVGIALALRKLEAKPPSFTRRFTFPVTKVPFKNGFAFEINFRDHLDNKRAIDEQALAEQRKAKIEKARARRGRKPTGETPTA